MGLIKAIAGAAGGVLADSWKEYFYCESIPNDVLVTKGHKRVSGRSSNTKGSDNIITTGSVIAVADGQCMIIVDQGKVVELCAEPGEFTYDASTEASIFSGSLGEGIGATFASIGKRFTFGGEAPKDQRVYYFNTKEIMGNKYGTANAVPFRVVDQNVGLDVDISIKCFGEYSYKIIDPILFYTNVCGNVSADYNRSQIDSQLKSELLTALQPAFAKISGMGVRYSAIPGHTAEIAQALNEELSSKWRNQRGIEIASFGVSSVKASEEDEKMIKDIQKSAVNRDPGMAQATMVGATADAMRDAAKNTNGAMMGFMGMNMAQNAGMGAMNNFQGNYGQAPANNYNTAADGGFGAATMQPKNANTWKCAKCGTENVGKFCQNCGEKKPEEVQLGWNCPKCGKLNQGKFCQECGEKKPEGALVYKCDKCGWEPEDPSNPPKFCPECGDPFGDEDIVR